MKLDILLFVAKQDSSQDSQKGKASGGTAYQVSENSATGAQDCYAFAVGAGEFAGGSEVDLKVGGVMLLAVLIDSDVSCNVIDQMTWEALKKESVQCDSKKSSKKLFACGQKEPIEVIGTFVPEIVCGTNGKTCMNSQ